MRSILARLGVIQTQVGFFPDINQKRQQDWGWMPKMENAPFSRGVAAWRSTDWVGGQLLPIHHLSVGSCRVSAGQGHWGRMQSGMQGMGQDMGCGMRDAGLFFSCSLTPQHPSWSDWLSFLPGMKVAFDPCCFDGIRRQERLILTMCAGTLTRAGATFTSQGDISFRPVTKSPVGSESPVHLSCRTCTDTAS